MRPVSSTLFDPSPTALVQDMPTTMGQNGGSMAHDEAEDPARQTARLLDGIETLIRAHKQEAAQRQVLHDKLDRVIAALESGLMPGSVSEPTTVTQASLGEDVRKGVSDDLKPLLHAIIDLLELATRPLDDGEAPSTEPEPCGAAGDPVPQTAARDEPEPDDELPRALPEILTKSVTELVGARGNRRANGADPKAAAAKAPTANSAPSARARVWIPVAPGTRAS